MASMAAPAGNPADLTSEPIPHGVTSRLGLPVITREQLFARGLESVVPPPTPQGALGWELDLTRERPDVCYLRPDATCRSWQSPYTLRLPSAWASVGTFSVREPFKNCGVFLKDGMRGHPSSMAPLVHGVRCTEGTTQDVALSEYTGCQNVVSKY